MKKIKFSCGCEFNIIDEKIKDIDNLPSIDLDFDNLNYNCPDTWETFHSGKTKGIFQLETQLGKTWASRTKPNSVEDIAALVSVIRPGTLKAIVDGKSMTQIYADRKNGKEEVVNLDESIADILEPTFGVIVFQEQSMRISQRLAGFNLQEADSLRKAMGKKDSELMNKVGCQFIEGCKKVGLVNEEKAKIIWDVIRKAERYSFNQCLSPESVVQTENGYKTIDDLNVGESILAPINDEIKFIPVLNKFESGEKDVYEVTLESGKTINATLNHRFLCEDGVCKSLYEILLDGSKIRTVESSELIVKNKYLGKMRTVDIEVDSESHIYFANGIATHNSHGVSYAILAYQTAYVKTHFPKHFYASWIRFSNEKMKPQDEVKELVSDAKGKSVVIHTPKYQFLAKNKNANIIKNEVYFGLSNVKGIGDSVINNMLLIFSEAEKKLNKNIAQFSWFELLCNALDKITSTACTNLISVGYFDIFNKTRKEMLHEYSIWSELTEKEKSLAISASNLEEALTTILELQKNKKRQLIIKSLINFYKNPPSSLEDKPNWMVSKESALLGVSVTHSQLDCVDTLSADTTCYEAVSGKRGNMILCVEIKNVSERTVKSGQNKGQKMAYLKVEDSTGSIDNIVAFAGVWSQHSNFLYENNTVVIIIKKYNDSLILESAKQI